jgi:hypothetical protein
MKEEPHGQRDAQRDDADAKHPTVDPSQQPGAEQTIAAAAVGVGT